MALDRPIPDMSEAIQQTCANADAIMAQLQSTGLDVTTQGIVIGPVKIGAWSFGPWTLPAVTIHVMLTKPLTKET
jgi:hypothetical protein